MLFRTSSKGALTGPSKTLKISQNSTKTCRYATGTELSFLANWIKLALCLWTSPGAWPLHVADLRKELCENETGSFSDAQLSEESASTVKAFRALNLGEESRPAKRRKKLPDSTEDINQSTYEQLVMTLNGSTQDSPVLNLSNLHNIIQ